MTESTGLPKWYDPRRPLLAFIDGPRGGEWCYGDRWTEMVALARRDGESETEGRTLMYHPVEGKIETHRTHESITGQAMSCAT